MPRCKICRVKFTARFFLQKTCETPECMIEYKNEVIQKEAQKDWNKRKKTIRIEVKKTDYKKALQLEVNKLARNIDEHFNYPCIDCTRELEYHLGGEKVNGAHFHDVGGNETLRFNLHNIHASTMFCNRYNTSHKTGYEAGLKSRYGLDYFNYINESIKLEYQLIKLSSQDIFEALSKARKCNREYKELIEGLKDGREARLFFNDLLDIY